MPLILRPVERAAGQPVDQSAGRDAELDLVVAGPLHVAGDRDDLGAGRLLGAEALEPVGARGDDVRHVGERLDVVDQGRPVVEALDGREGRLQPRVAALALERVEQSGLLAADVGAGAAVDDQLHLLAGAEHVLAEEAGLVGLLDRRVEDVALQVVLAADVDEAAVGPGGAGGDDDPLDQLVRVLLHQLAVLEGARLGLVGVAAEVLVHVAAGQEGGLLAHREAGAAAAPQAGVLELLQDLLGGHLLVGLLDRLVAAELAVGVDRGQPRLVDVAEEQPGLLRRPSALDLPGVGAPGELAVLEPLLGQHLLAPERSCSTAASASSSSSGP